MSIGTHFLAAILVFGSCMVGVYNSSAAAQPILTNPTAIIWSGDYPIDALRRGDEGVTEFRLGVGKDGRAKSCVILSSAGLEEFDSIVCKRMLERAIFDLSKMPKNSPAINYYSNKIRWTLGISDPRERAHGIDLIQASITKYNKIRCEFSDGKITFVIMEDSCFSNKLVETEQLNDSAGYNKYTQSSISPSATYSEYSKIINEICQSYVGSSNQDHLNNCFISIYQIERQARLQQQQYDLERKKYEQQLAVYESQQRAIKKERDRQRWETLARWGTGMAQSQSPSFWGAVGDANAAALGLPPVTKPPAPPPPPPEIESFTIRMANGRSAACTYSATFREVRCR